MLKHIVVSFIIAFAAFGTSANAQRGYLSESRFVGYEPASPEGALVPIFFEHEKYYNRVVLDSVDEFLAADLMSQFNVQKSVLRTLPFSHEMANRSPNGVIRTVPAIRLEVVTPRSTYSLDAVERPNRDVSQTSNIIFQSGAARTIDKTSETAPLTVDVLKNTSLTLYFIHIPTGERLEVYSGRFVRIN